MAAQIKVARDHRNPDSVIVMFSLRAASWHSIHVHKHGELFFSFNQLELDATGPFIDALHIAIEGAETLAGKGIPVDEWIELQNSKRKRIEASQGQE